MSHRPEDAERDRQYALERARDHRARCIAFLGDECVDCGAIDDLHISHNVPSQKHFDPGRMWSADWDTVVRPELDGSNGSGGCSCRCRTCHVKYDGQLLWGTDDGKPPHRTSARYNLPSDPCRCEECVEAERERNRDRDHKSRANLEYRAARNKRKSDSRKELRVLDPTWRAAENKYKRDYHSERLATEPEFREAHNKRQRDAQRKRLADPARREEYNKYHRELAATKRALKNLVPPKEWSTPVIEDITEEYFGAHS